VNRRLHGRRGRPARCVSVESIRSLYGQGYSFRAIALTTGIGYGTVRRAFHGLAPIGADMGADHTAPPRRVSDSGRKLKMAAAG
jgi:transposase